ncbi:hypothetical protein X975_05443, partial [Stegodyphus mimosarum]
MTTFSIDKMHRHAGYLVINEDGGIIASGGDLECNEKIAEIFYQMVKGVHAGILSLSENGTGFRKLSINYDDHFYVIAVSNKKIHVVKRSYNDAE